MTFDECQRELDSIRRNQGTACPLIRVDFGGSTYRGLLTRADSDSDSGASASAQFGVLVLEEPGLIRSPQTILQIASIAPGAIKDSRDN